MQLCCQECSTMLELDLKGRHRVDSDDYWHEYGQRAKHLGWHIVHQSTSPPEWLVLFSFCGKKRKRPRVCRGMNHPLKIIELWTRDTEVFISDVMTRQRHG